MWFRGSKGSAYLEYGLMDHNTVKSDTWASTFRVIMLLPSAG